MNEADLSFQNDDEIHVGNDAVGYRVVLDLSNEDADLIDQVARQEGLQPTQILLHALRAYARGEPVQSARVAAITRLADALRDETQRDTAAVRGHRRVA